MKIKRMMIISIISWIAMLNVNASHDFEFTSIAGLRAASIPTNQSTAFVKGYYTANDNGGGMFMWDSSSSKTDNGGTVIIPDSQPATGRWIRMYDKNEIIVNWFGAKGDNSTDDTSAIQNAIDEAESMGGTVIRLLPAQYIIGSTLSLPDGVRFLGSADSYNGTGVWNGKGTVLNYTGTGVAISIEGRYGYGFEISHMHLLGNGNGDTGIHLTYTTGSTRPPRSGEIHDMSIKGFGGNALLLDCFSYCSFRNINVVCPEDSIGINITDVSSLYHEFGWFENIYINGDANIGVRVDYGNNIYFKCVDVNDCDTGIYIHGHCFNIFFDHTNIVRSLSNGIDIYADTSHINRIIFDRTTILMNGELDSEHAIYSHRAGSYTVQNSIFNYLDINKVGTVSPVNAIDCNTSGFTYNKLSGIRNCSGGNISYASSSILNLDFIDIKNSQCFYASGTGSETSFNFTISSSSPYCNPPVINVNTNQSIPYALSVVNTQGGDLGFTLTFATPPASGNSNIKVYYQIAR